MSNLPPGVTGMEPYFAAPQASCENPACGHLLCDRALALGASECCDCTGRYSCPDCYPEVNGGDDDDGT